MARGSIGLSENSTPREPGPQQYTDSSSGIAICKAKSLTTSWEVCGLLVLST